nr:MAG TPA: hypothetical protein [Caudoviricetes sp.]
MAVIRAVLGHKRFSIGILLETWLPALTLCI